MATEAQPAEPGETHSVSLGFEMFLSTEQAPGDARRWARKLLSSPNKPAIAKDVLDSIDVLVSELVTNVFLHTEATEIWVEVTQIKNVLRVKVTDDGSGEWGEAGPDREGGRGLGLVELLSDSWGTEGVNCVGATQVWFELKVAG